MPLQSSGTINLSDVIEEFGNGTNNSVDLITAGDATGTVTAPVTGFVVVEVVGAGGGGGGSTGSPYNGGGGGSGAWAKELIYINAGETLTYFVGTGGNFGEGPGGPGKRLQLGQAGPLPGGFPAPRGRPARRHGAHRELPGSLPEAACELSSRWS